MEEALKTVVDPEVGLNIVDLGLIYGLDVDDEGDVQLELTLTSPGCPVGPMILEEVQSTLESVLPHKQVLISLVFDPPWSPERISEEGRSHLDL
ncbi:MAG: aromatic ring hydroxylase [Spirochaetaceae bacterium]|nr:aromatic ring hydroxylase [Spirochaetaceae bacterium]